MTDRHGIGRLRWLQENDPHILRGTVGYEPHEVPRIALLSPQEVTVEVAFALIEELHDAIAFWSTPQIGIK